MASKHLKVLGLTATATKEDVRATYHRLVKVYHPDTGGATANTVMFQQVQEAYDWLRVNHVVKVPPPDLKKFEKYFRIISKLPATIGLPFSVAEEDSIVFVMHDDASFSDGSWNKNFTEYRIILKKGVELPVKTEVQNSTIVAVHDPQCTNPREWSVKSGKKSQWS